MGGDVVTDEQLLELWHRYIEEASQLPPPKYVQMDRADYSIAVALRRILQYFQEYVKK